jgi:hypothetical protein
MLSTDCLIGWRNSSLSPFAGNETLLYLSSFVV